jgi:hypothetical protein
VISSQAAIQAPFLPVSEVRVVPLWGVRVFLELAAVHAIVDVSFVPEF